MTKQVIQHVFAIACTTVAAQFAQADSRFAAIPPGPHYSARFIVTFDLEGLMVGCKLKGVYDRFDTVKPLDIKPPDRFVVDACRQIDPHWTQNARKILAGDIVCEYFASQPETAFCSHRFRE